MLGTNWYECKVEGEKIGENGPQKSKPESYLVDAMTFTDAEARIKIQLFFVTLDEKNQQEKRTANYMLVQAENFRGALDRFVEGMKGTMADYEIAAIQETNLLDVFPFAVEE